MYFNMQPMVLFFGVSSDVTVMLHCSSDPHFAISSLKIYVNVERIFLNIG
jgi:hypothetical protein